MATGDNQKQAPDAIRLPDVVLILARIGRAVKRSNGCLSRPKRNFLFLFFILIFVMESFMAAPRAQQHAPVVRPASRFLEVEVVDGYSLRWRLPANKEILAGRPRRMGALVVERAVP